MGLANVRASRYGIRECAGGYSSTNAGAGAGPPASTRRHGAAQCAPLGGSPARTVPRLAATRASQSRGPTLPGTACSKSAEAGHTCLATGVSCTPLSSRAHRENDLDQPRHHSPTYLSMNTSVFHIKEREGARRMDAKRVACLTRRRAQAVRQRGFVNHLAGRAVLGMGRRRLSSYWLRWCRRARRGPVLRLFPPCALISHAQGSSGVVGNMPFAWRGHTKSLATRARPSPDLAVWLE